MQETTRFSPLTHTSPGFQPEDPFEGYFQFAEKIRLCPILEKNRMAGRWLNNINQAMQHGLYTFHQASQSKMGAEIMVNDQRMYAVSSYDYLGLNGHPEIEQAAIDAIASYGTSTGGARLLAGSIELHRKLETKLARYTGKEAAMTLTSGYMANIAVISALIQKADRVIVDEYIHRSIADALNLSQIAYEKFKHNDMDALRQGLEHDTGQKTFVIVEGVYSMDGDICPLPELLQLKNKYNFFIILDESHALGTLGASGKGTCEHFEVSTSDIDIITSSLNKAIPAGGGFVAASMQVIIYLRHGASPYMFSTSLSPSAAGSAYAALEILEREGHLLVKQLRNNIDYLKKGLNRLGYDTGNTESAVIPVIIGHKETTLLLSATLFSLGFLATPVVFPAVPPGGDRLRLCATAAQSKVVLNKIIDAFAICLHLTTQNDRAA